MSSYKLAVGSWQWAVFFARDRDAYCTFRIRLIRMALTGRWQQPEEECQEEFQKKKKEEEREKKDEAEKDWLNNNIHNIHNNNNINLVCEGGSHESSKG